MSLWPSNFSRVSNVYTQGCRHRSKCGRGASAASRYHAHHCCHMQRLVHRFENCGAKNWGGGGGGASAPTVPTPLTLTQQGFTKQITYYNKDNMTALLELTI